MRLYIPPHLYKRLRRLLQELVPHDDPVMELTSVGGRHRGVLVRRINGNGATKVRRAKTAERINTK